MSILSATSGASQQLKNSDARIVVGYSDGSIASMAMLPHLAPSFHDCGDHWFEAGRVRRLRRLPVSEDGEEEGSGEAGITALCSLAAPLGLLVVAGDSDGRLGLWTTSTHPSSGSPLLWEDSAAHTGPVVAIQRVGGTSPSAESSSAVSPNKIIGAPPPPRPRQSEWVVSVGSGGEVRVWKVPSRWPAAFGVLSQSVGLEFCATLLTYSSIGSFSCVPLCPSNRCGLSGGKTDGGNYERVGGGKRRRKEVGEIRLYCVIGSDNGFVQAWEISLMGEEGVGGQPLWSQKAHDAAVTTMDACGVNLSGYAGSGHIMSEFNNGNPTPTRESEVGAEGWKGRKQAEDHRGGNEIVALCQPELRKEEHTGTHTSNCLVVSGSLDRSVCIFRAGFGEGLRLLRRLNIACSPRGLPGALLANLPVDGEYVGESRREIGVLLAAADGEITRLGVKYKFGSVLWKQSPKKVLLGTHKDIVGISGGSGPSSAIQLQASGSGDVTGRDGIVMPREGSKDKSLWTAATIGPNILDKVPRSDKSEKIINDGGRQRVPPHRSLSTSASLPKKEIQDTLPKQRRQEPGQRQLQHSPSVLVDENDMVGSWESSNGEDNISLTASPFRTTCMTTSAVSTSLTTLPSTFDRQQGQQFLVDVDGALSTRSSLVPMATEVAPGRPVGIPHPLLNGPESVSLLSSTAAAAPFGGTLREDNLLQRREIHQESETQPLQERGQKRLRQEEEQGVEGALGPEPANWPEVLRRSHSYEGVANINSLQNGSQALTPAQEPGRRELALPSTTSSTTTNESKFMGDTGRWQQGLGISVEENGRRGSHNPRTTRVPVVLTAGDLMKDRSLKEAFATRGRHKKSPVLAREVKATLKAWSPGIVEACSRASFEAAMGNLRGNEKVTFERVCEIAAVVLTSKKETPIKRIAGPYHASLSNGSAYKGKIRVSDTAARGAGRPAQYHEMLKSKTRLKYNSMGERVVVRTALESLDAFAARNRQYHLQQPRSQNQQSDGAGTGVPPEEKKQPWDFHESKEGKGDGDQGVMLYPDGRGINWNSTQHDGDDTEDTVFSAETTLKVSKSLGFGWPNYSSVGSRVAEGLHTAEEINAARLSRATAAHLGSIPSGFRDVWSRQGSCLFSSWSASFRKISADSPPVGTAGLAEILSEGECVRAVREIFDKQAAATAASLVACRRRGRCPPGAHSLVVGDNGERGFAPGSAVDKFCIQDSTRTAPSLSVVIPFDAGGEDAESIGRSFSSAATSIPASEGGSDPYPGCPASRLEPVGVTLYRDFRRRYGLQRTAEERVAGLLGSILEHGIASAVLRLFARIVGTPAGESEESIWPCQTVSEEADQGLETQLTELITTARDWLIVRGFMTMDGPWVGCGIAGSSTGIIGWKKAQVTRTHAAMCAAAVLRSGWGSGHRIMGAAEQAILDLPTVRRSCRWAGQRGLEPWSEFVDGEEFLEILLVLVLRAGEASRETSDSLFGAKAVVGHSFLPANPRGINAAAPKKNVASGILEPLEKIAKEDTAPSATEANTDYKPAEHEGNSSGYLSDGNRKGKLKYRVEELGVEGELLKRLKPLLDSFIREDSQRTGTLPISDFRRVLCDGHAKLWPKMATTGDGRGNVEAGNTLGGASVPVIASEFTDPRLTLVENEAARAIVRRFADAFDGQICYLDVWITLYHAVFRTGQLIPFTELPFVCETQLRGADTAHWGSLLAYLEAVGVGSLDDNLTYAELGNTNVEFSISAVAGAQSESRGKGGLNKQQSAEVKGGAIAGGGAGCAGALTQVKSAPTIGLLRTIIDGGVSPFHTTTTGEFRPIPRTNKTASTSIPGIATEWPRPEWAPGSLTICRPPRTAGPPGTVVSATAVMTALNSAGSAGLGDTGGVSPSSRVEREGRKHVYGCDCCSSGFHVSKNYEAAMANSSSLPPGDRMLGRNKRGEGRKLRGGAETHDDKNGSPSSADNHSGHRLPTNTSTSVEDDVSTSGSDLVIDFDCGTLVPPSPEPPSPERQGYPGESLGECFGGEKRRGRRKKEKRTMTSLYVRCPFLDPVKKKHSYRVPRRGHPNFPATPIFHEASDAASATAQLYSSIASAKAKKIAAEGVKQAERERVSSAKRELSKNRRRGTSAESGDGPGEEGAELLTLESISSLKETMLREGRSRSKEGHGVGARIPEPGPGGGGGKGGEEAAIAAADGREAWTGKRPRMKSVDLATALGLAFDPDGFVLEGTATGRSSKASSTSPRKSKTRARSPVREKPKPAASVTSPTPPTIKKPSKPKPTAKASRRGRGRRVGALERPEVRRRRKEPETVGDSDDDSDDDSDEDDEKEKALDAKKAAQQKMIEGMMAEQAAKRRASGDAMKNLIAEEDERKRQIIAGEEAAKVAQEQAKKQAEERHRRELDERRKALAKKKAELEETNRRLEEERAERQATRELEDQARREEKERLRREEAARQAEQERLAREENARFALEEEERLKREEEERLEAEVEAVKKKQLERERAREARELERMVVHDEDINIILQEILRIACEVERLRLEAEAIKRAQGLQDAADDARRKHAGLLMSKADIESRDWNDAWASERKAAAAMLLDFARKEKRGRVTVIRDKFGNPIDLRMWEIECTTETDSDGRLLQRATYADVDGYAFDPRDVFQGEGGGIGGRGGGRGDGTTRSNPTHSTVNLNLGKEGEPAEERPEYEAGGSDAADECLDAEGFLERERRWMEGVFAAFRPEDLSCLFRNIAGSFNPNTFSRMVLTERVAWPELMETARAVLFEQAEVTAKKQRKVVDLTRCKSPCRMAGGVNDGSNPFPLINSKHRNSLGTTCTPDLTTPGVSPGMGVAAAQEASTQRQGHRGCHENSRNWRRGKSSDDYADGNDITPTCKESLGEAAFTAAYDSIISTQGDISGEKMATFPLIVGRTWRGTTSAGPNPWTLFRFDIPHTGPVLTILLDAIDDNMKLFVSRGKVPGATEGATVAVPVGSGEWEGLSKFGALRVVKIFPHDPSYGAGKYFVGVLSRGPPSQFALKVSAATAEDEISTHMRTAAAIVDNLAIMSNMDPHRLIKDFVGARLEAEETLRKQKAAALNGRGDDYSFSDPASVSVSSSGTAVDTRILSEFSSDNSSAACSYLGYSLEERQEGEPILSALRHREQGLASRVAVLDDRMARVRPTGLLVASVSTSALASGSSLGVGVTSQRVLIRGGSRGGSRNDFSSGILAVATPDRLRCSQRNRSLSIPLMPTAIGGEGVEKNGEGTGDQEIRRPWTTSNCMNVEPSAEGRGEWSGVVPHRYSVRCLDHTHSGELKASAGPLRKAPPLSFGRVKGAAKNPGRGDKNTELFLATDFAPAYVGKGRPSREIQEKAWSGQNIGNNEHQSRADREGRRLKTSDGTTKGPEQRNFQNQSRPQSLPTGLFDSVGSSDGETAGAGRYFPIFRSDLGTAPRIYPMPSSQSWPSNALPQFSSVSSHLLLSKASTASGSGRGERRGLKAVVDDREAAEAEARQDLAKVEPNLFPEIFVSPAAERSSEEMRGWRGWLPTP